MLTMDVFNTNPFQMISLTEAVRRSKTIPGLIGSLGLFTPRPVRTRTVAIEQIGHTLNIIQTSEPGAPRTRRANEKRSILDLRVRRIEESSQITAEEIQGIRDFGETTALKQLQKEIGTRQQSCIDDLSATVERLRLSCINGILVDADDTVIYNYYTTFGFVQGSEIDFNWAARTGCKKFVAANVIRPTIRALGGMAPPGMRIMALCGDDFFDDLQENSEYRATYLNNEKSSKLLEDTVFQSVEAWGVTWVNYRGTDDNSTVAIAADKCKIFPVGVRGLFVEAFAPAPTFPTVNSLGQEWYSRVIPDMKRQEYADVEVESHRLPICTRPEVLLQGNK